jgi:hypothetical protein
MSVLSKANSATNQPRFGSAPVRSRVLLAPANVPVLGPFRNISHAASTHRHLLSAMQRLRGRLYLEDKAIRAAAIAADGRHVLSDDNRSWHLLTLDSEGAVVGCARYLLHGPGVHFDALKVSRVPLGNAPEWRAPLRLAVESELAIAQAAGLAYVEVGGWAMDRSIRCTTECLRSVLTTFAWSRLIGGALGIATATERNGSASILQRLGGQPLEWEGIALPPYFDPEYECRMHVLRFDSQRPNSRYEESVEQLRQELVDLPVISPSFASPLTIGHGFVRSEKLRTDGLTTGLSCQ